VKDVSEKFGTTEEVIEGVINRNIKTEIEWEEITLQRYLNNIFFKNHIVLSYIITLFFNRIKISYLITDTYNHNFY